MPKDFDPPGITFFDAASGREMMYVDPGFANSCAGWILWKHADGQWVTLRKATSEDLEKIKVVIENQQSVKVLAVSADLMSILVEGEPLESLGLENAVFVDEKTGEIRGQLRGFFVNPGESASEALRRQIPPGCYLRIS